VVRRAGLRYFEPQTAASSFRGASAGRCRASRHGLTQLSDRNTSLDTPRDRRITELTSYCDESVAAVLLSPTLSNAEPASS
jgi:hypothetical protein